MKKPGERWRISVLIEALTPVVDQTPLLHPAALTKV
jgi:hypothetical protein